MDFAGLGILITAVSGAVATVVGIFRKRRRNGVPRSTHQHDLLAEYRRLVEELRREAARLRRVGERDQRSCRERIEALTTRLVELEGELSRYRVMHP